MQMKVKNFVDLKARKITHSSTIKICVTEWYDWKIEIMVGVGPGVGADVIRQRRKRADKLKKEQKVIAKLIKVEIH